MGIEPMNKGFADPRLTTWPRRLVNLAFESYRKNLFVCSPRIQDMRKSLHTTAINQVEIKISVVVLTYNEEKHIGDCLDSVQWADSRLVFDSYSTDRTQAIAQAAGAQILERPFRNFADQRNAALNAVETEWVFFIDADERCTTELAGELREVARTVDHPVWSVPRDNYLFGRLTRGAGWFPDFQARFFRAGEASFDPAREVHEVAVYRGTMGFLQNRLIHYNYETVAQFHVKQRKYAALEAGILYKQGVHPKPRNFFLQPLREFKRRYVALKGFRDGFHGLRLSLLLAYYNLEMYRRLARLWRDH